MSQNAQFDPEDSSAVVGPSRPRLLSVLGPGLITGASDDDPSGIATYSQAGAQFGYALGWTMLLTYPLMAAVQMISARIGRTTGKGIAGAMREHYPPSVLAAAVLLLLAANILNLGADLGAMSDALSLLLPAPPWLYILFFASVCVALQLFLQYTRYVSVLKWLTLALFSYVAAALLVGVDWRSAAIDLVVPTILWRKDFLTTLVALFGTTISPYLFFWQSAEEVEDLHVYPKRRDLLDAPMQGPAALFRIELDTLVGMGLSNLIALAIILTTAATLHRSGITDIQTASQAAEALRPIAGRFAYTLFVIGIIGTGLLSVPVLAGSAAYAIGEARSWPIGLGRRPKEAQAFYTTLVLATLVGMVINFAPIDPIQALYWSAVINGVVSVPLMLGLMLLASRRDVMGKFAVSGLLAGFGWAATAVMALAVAAMFATMVT